MNPKVTFVVPCYKLAHLLPDCIDSILTQTYRDFEILIMDDCSPDNTAEVGQSFTDPRVKHIRNEPNLGHLRNYNKGIELAQGEYVWLISADDRLRRPYILESYVGVMNAHPEVGYACCPAFELMAGKEVRAEYSVVAERDTVFKGHEFLKKLREGNCVIAASGMVRKSCYDKFGLFPLDMGYAGDWYLWCLFAVYCDVAYFAEPMVNYRIHELSITSAVMKDRAGDCAREDLMVLWRILRKAEKSGYANVAEMFKRAIASRYVWQLTFGKFDIFPHLTPDEFRNSLHQYVLNNVEERWFRGWVFAQLGDRRFHAGDSGGAAEFYTVALREGGFSAKTFIKLSLLHAGPVGAWTRRAVFGSNRSRPTANDEEERTKGTKSLDKQLSKKLGEV